MKFLQEEQVLIIDKKEYVCSLDYGMEIIKGKWKSVIICQLNKSPIRFLELQRQLPNISHKVLTEKLKELENDGIVEKEVFMELPPRVEYKLTEVGFNLYEVLRQLEIWSRNYIEELKNRRVNDYSSIIPFSTSSLTIFCTRFQSFSEPSAIIELFSNICFEVIPNSTQVPPLL